MATNAASFTVQLPEHATALFFTGTNEDAQRLLRAAHPVVTLSASEGSRSRDSSPLGGSE